MPELAAVRELILDGNRIGDQGVGYLVGREWHGLEILDLSIFYQDRCA